MSRIVEMTSQSPFRVTSTYIRRPDSRRYLTGVSITIVEFCLPAARTHITKALLEPTRESGVAQIATVAVTGWSNTPMREAVKMS
jgi:hypothetical protein